MPSRLGFCAFNFLGFDASLFFLFWSEIRLKLPSSHRGVEKIINSGMLRGCARGWRRNYVCLSIFLTDLESVYFHFFSALNYWSILLIHGFQIIPACQSNWIAFSSTFTYWSILLLFSLLLSWVPNNTSLQIKLDCLCLHVDRLGHDPVGRCGRSPSSGYDDKYVQLDVIQPWD